VEAVELPGHPFYLATLFQPQMESLTTGVLHPILGALIAAASPGSLAARSRGRSRSATPQSRRPDR
jgi:hypothetical protein